MPLPVNILQALFAAGFWGMGDFSGGMSVKSAPSAANPLGAALRVVLYSHLTSFTVLIAILLATHQPSPGASALAWGISAGILAGVSLSAFYIALSRGAMGASAAISGLLAAGIPAAVTVLLEGSPGPHRLIGFVIAGVAIWLIAAGPAERESLNTILLATGAGVGFGLYFVALKYAGTHAVPLWTMTSARVGSLSTCAMILLVYKMRGRHSPAPKLVILNGAKAPCMTRFAGPAASMPISRRMKLWILSTALFDTSGNLLFVAATRAGRLDIASVLASLYPASTILLAAAVLRERPTARQFAGIAVAVGAVILITL